MSSGLLGMLKGENFGKAVLQIEELKVSIKVRASHSNSITLTAVVSHGQGPRNDCRVSGDTVSFNTKDTLAKLNAES